MSEEQLQRPNVRLSSAAFLNLRVWRLTTLSQRLIFQSSIESRLAVLISLGVSSKLTLSNHWLKSSKGARVLGATQRLAKFIILSSSGRYSRMDTLEKEVLIEG